MKESSKRLIHTSQSFSKKLTKKNESRRENLYKDIFLLNEENDEESSENDAQAEIDITIINNKEKIKVKFNQNKAFTDFVKFLQKNYFRVGFEENYKIYYQNKEIEMSDKRKINKIINPNDTNVKFTLKSMKKEFLYSNLNRIYIQLDNIPSFMDLSQQIYNFIKLQTGEEINYDINYKDNSCRILFNSQEIAFSFVAYMTNIKFTNKYYRKLKIDIKYNQINATRNNRHIFRYMSEENKINNINKTIDSLTPNNNNLNLPLNKHNMRTYKSYIKKNNKAVYYYENTYENDYYEDNYKSIRDSSPYGYEKELEKQKKIKDKKNWVGQKDFFTSINKKSFNKLLRPKKKLILKKVNMKELSGSKSKESKNENPININDKKSKPLLINTYATNMFKFKNSPE